MVNWFGAPLPVSILCSSSFGCLWREDDHDINARGRRLKQGLCTIIGGREKPMLTPILTKSSGKSRDSSSFQKASKQRFTEAGSAFCSLHPQLLIQSTSSNNQSRPEESQSIENLEVQLNACSSFFFPAPRF
ncbi:hypothetical protein GQ43DRAFT_72978 [Delitschia confertaspora ATCC 74209]|uniref:Uncharacterized protein n=1 Tax=Delitschia confertaspora ATCC 74209 TaxID=1513339 RepID=A0A9P4MRZ0_9PLEO|nr:hypothetical protein GQ43DRAFT_72978 [Delitschia confertaspora ATCC 74209]